jgi:hypothetical protein
MGHGACVRLRCTHESRSNWAVAAASGVTQRQERAGACPFVGRRCHTRVRDANLRSLFFLTNFVRNGMQILLDYPKVNSVIDLDGSETKSHAANAVSAMHCRCFPNGFRFGCGWAHAHLLTFCSKCHGPMPNCRRYY